MSILKTATTFIAENTAKVITTGAIAGTAVTGGAGYVTLDNQIEDTNKEVSMVAESKKVSDYEDLDLVIAELNQKVANLESDVVKLKENQGKSETVAKTETTTPTTTTTPTPAPKPVVETKGEVDDLIALKNAKVAKGEASDRNDSQVVNGAKGFATKLSNGTYVTCWEIKDKKAICVKDTKAIAAKDAARLPKMDFAETKKLLT